MKNQEIGVLKFRFDSRMASLLGQQSVSNNVAAIFELVKNAYDADATKAEVIFRGGRDADHKLVIKKIEIRDNGVGMTFEDFRDKWMVVGTNTKEREISSPKYRRRVAGEKGIGRFSTERLGRKVIIRSDPEKFRGRETEYSGKRIMVTIDWTKYEPGTTFDEIGNEFRVLERENLDQHGLEITIEDLRDDWTEDNLRDLSERMSWLIVPDQVSSDSNLRFDAKVLTEGFAFPSIAVEPAFLKKAPFSIETKLRGNLIHYVIYEKGEPKQDSRKVSQEPMDFANACGDAEFKLYFYPGDESRDIKYSTYYRKVLGASEFESRLEKFCGVKIYNDGVRLLPYGLPGNDWLGLNKLYAIRRAGALRNERVIGLLSLCREKNPEIRETTTREGIIQNRAFECLRDFAIRSMRLLASFVQEVKSRDAKHEDKEAASVISDDVTAIRSDLAISEMPKDVKKEVSERLARIARNASRIERDLADSADERQLYRNLASVGITSLAFAHEIVYPLSNMNSAVNNLQKGLKPKNSSLGIELDELISISNSISSVLHWTDHIRSYGNLLASSRPKDRHKINVKKFVEETFKPFNEILKNRGIEVKNRIPDYIQEVIMNRADLESILVNLLTNSVKSLDSTDGRAKMIQLSVQDNQSGLQLTFSDNGIGVPASEKERIFEPFYASKYGRQTAGTKSTGMGLTIAREILDEYDGNIKLTNSEFECGASFLINIPWKPENAK